MKAVTYRDAGVRVRVTDGISKGSVGVTTGDVSEAEFATLVGVQLAYRFRYIREDWLEPEPIRHSQPEGEER